MSDAQVIVGLIGAIIAMLGTILKMFIDKRSAKGDYSDQLVDNALKQLKASVDQNAAMSLEMSALKKSVDSLELTINVAFYANRAHEKWDDERIRAETAAGWIVPPPPPLHPIPISPVV